MKSLQVQVRAGAGEGAEPGHHQVRIATGGVQGRVWRNWRLASTGLKRPSKRIDEAIKDLEKTKEALHKSANNLRLANDKAQDVTIKKLTYLSIRPKT
jgi:hypothetical protein